MRVTHEADHVTHAVIGSAQEKAHLDSRKLGI